MYDSSRHAVRLRTALIWVAVTAATAGLTVVAVPEVLAAIGSLRAGATSFPELLVGGCVVAALVAAGVLWVVTTDVALSVLRAPRCAVRRPGPLRLLVLAACGVVAVSGPASASRVAVAPIVAAAEREPGPSPDRSLAGLPLPDRASSDATVLRPPESEHRVRPGDSLWAIAEQRLGPRATVADIVSYWQRVYDLNADVIGPDPDLILPGQLLHLPPTAA